MKKIILGLSIIVFSYSTNAQILSSGGENTTNAAVEIYMGTENVSPSSKFITFKLDAISPVIKGTQKTTTIYEYEFTSSYQHLSYPIPDNNKYIDDWEGFDFVTSKTNPPTYSVFAYALYKFSLENSNMNFYLDYRDERIGKYELYSPPTTGHNMDIWIKYNEATNKFYYSSSAPASWVPIENGEYLAFWEIKGKGVPATINFPDGFWDNSLFIFTSNNYHPQIVWTFIS